MRYLICLLSILGLFWLAQPAYAASCRTLNHHAVCLIQVQRSAKYFWQYRVISSIDGVQQPEMIYNCRDRSQQQKGKPPIPLELGGVGEWICNSFS